MVQSKATRKFEKNKLGDVLKKRKDVAKIKQRKQMDLKKKERKARDNARADDLEDDKSKKTAPKADKGAALDEMSMDQFFQGGFQLPEMSKSKASKSKTGKRKRTPVEDGDSDVDMAEANGASDDSASDSDSGDDAEAHKEQLAELQKKDPEFYKYLKDNDAELLDFAEDADLAEIDALSASEDEATPRKKKKADVDSDDEEEEEEDESAGGNEVSLKLIQKWKIAMEEKSSLRAMREVVLAFRTAAHLNDEEGKKYKYSISDPDGMLKSSSRRQRLTRCSVSPSSCYSSSACSKGFATPSTSERERWRQDVSHPLMNIDSILTKLVEYQPIQRSFAHSHPFSSRTQCPYITSWRTCPMLRLFE